MHCCAVVGCFFLLTSAATTSTFFFFNDTATTEIYTLSLHDALPIWVVEEAGRGVKHLKKGDRVVVPFVIACGECFFFNRSLFAACEETNSGRGAIINKKSARPGAGLFGYSHLYGGYSGGQAEYARVPQANAGPILIPDFLGDDQVLFLSDFLPTGYQAALDARISNGTKVAIFGAGPVGLMSALCARFLGAETIFMVDDNVDRLEFAKQTYGVIPINFSDIDDPAEFILENTRSEERRVGKECRSRWSPYH